jgi:hypothetical protein
MKYDLCRSIYSKTPRWRSLAWLLLLLAPTGHASGWNDFVLDIGGGYQVSKMSSLEVCIGKDRGPLILCGTRGSDIGPVNGYIVTPEHIFGRTLGRKRVAYDDGHVGDSVDTGQVHYFVIDKRTDLLRGPFARAEFEQRPEVAALGTLDWELPANPGAWLLIGVVAVGLGIVLFILAVPVIGVALLVGWLRRRYSPHTAHTTVSSL